MLEQDIEDVGELFGWAHPGATFPVPRVPSLSLEGPLERGRSRDIVLCVSLETDIWFPWVVGWRDDGEDSDGPAVQFRSNTEVAACHTPRLNRFLSAMRDKVLEVGGTWEIGDEGGLADTYAPWIGDVGIRLGVMPP